LASLSPHSIPSTGLLTINCQSLVSNWRLLQARMHSIDPRSECAAVVKADAYGLGVEKVSSALLKAGCRTFFVATLSEGVELRGILAGESGGNLHSSMPYGDDAPTIIVLGGLSHGVGREWHCYQLVPVLFDVDHFQYWSDYQQSLLQEKGMLVKDKRLLPCVIKLDTGMHRMGVSAEDFGHVCSDQHIMSNLSPLLLMSHLACADEPEHPLNIRQLSQFQQQKQLAERYFPSIRFSLANSSGLFLGEDYMFDLGRPGIAIYGGNPTPYDDNPMNPIVQLSLPIMQLKTVQVGESVGYGASFTVTRVTHLAVVFGGYADGMLRALSHSGFAYYAGKRVPLVGRVSMDSMVFDVTDVELSKDADSVEVFGLEQTIDDIAKKAGTIGYEVLTNLGARYHRQYISSKGAL